MTAAGLLLTGGSSSRLGVDKLALRTTKGITVADHVARVLSAVAHPVVEVGPGITSLEAIPDEACDGPLGAIARSAPLLRSRGTRTVLVVAGDLPRLTGSALEMIAGHSSAADVVAPRIDGVPQVLCARYSRRFLGAVTDAYERGERSLRRLVETANSVFLDEAAWRGEPDGAAVFDDIDTLPQLEALLRDRVLISTAPVNTSRPDTGPCHSGS